MNPAAPVISAFMRRPLESREHPANAIRQPAGAPALIQRGVHGPAGRSHQRIRSEPHFVPELHAYGRQQPSFGPDLQLVVVPRGTRVFAMCFDHRQRNTSLFHLAITPAERPQQIRARDLEPHEVVRVVDHAHLVGLGVADAHRRRRGLDDGHLTAAPAAADRRSRTACATSAAPKTVWPDTRTVAPAATTRAAFEWSMPPSISTTARDSTRSSS